MKELTSRLVVLLVLVLLGLGAAAQGFVAAPQAVPSTAESDLPEEDDEFEDADEDLYEEDDEETWSSRQRELAEVVKEIDIDIEELRQEEEHLWAKHLEGRRRHAAGLLVLAKHIVHLEQRQAKAEAEQDFDTVTRLADKAEAYIESFERIEHLGEVEGTLSELKILQRELAEDGSADSQAKLARLIQGQEKLLKLVRQFYHLLDADDEEELEWIEEQIDQLAEPLELRIREFFLERELAAASDEDNNELVHELREIRVELREFEGYNFGPEPTKPLQKAASTPPIQPVLVTRQALAEYSNADLHRDVAPLLRKYCFECHSNDVSSGELNFERLLAVSPIVKNRQQWINVIEQTKNHVMPPEDATQPTTTDREKIVLSLHNAIYNFDYSQVSDPGFEKARRLTHREYSNTVRDLFGTAIDVVDRFPDDLTASSGFDNSGNSLFIQPLLLERYIGLAEHVVTTALPASPETAAEQKAWQRIFVSRPTNGVSTTSAARQVMRPFLLRAYRRPPSEAETTRYVARIKQAVQQGRTFEEAVKASLQIVLISPNFLLLNEPSQDENDGVFPVGDYELASRLSYFLWASMPDDELLTLAESSQLSQTATLTQQVERMLADPKSATLGTVFAAQWLGSQHLGKRVRLDPIDNPWCTETLMSAMRQETSMFFNSLVRENRPISNLVSADYTFLNEELAELYGVRGVSGTAMRRVTVDANRRGGIFGQGSLLAVTSFPGRTSPVVRGKWILDTVLGTPPPPPPPNVSELSEEIETARRLSFREKLELHREKPNCYACHSQMDPLGFSLENYDWFGRHRSRRGGERIDASGQLPDGTQFAGLSGLKQVITEQRQDDLVRQVTQKLLSYALGRQLEYYDEKAIRDILQNLAKNDNRMASLVQEITLSYPFRYKRNRQTEHESVGPQQPLN